MKLFIKKFLFVTLLLGSSLMITTFPPMAKYNQYDFFGWPIWLLLISIITIVYTLFFLLIDRIHPTSFKYTIIFNLIFATYLIIFFIWDFFILSNKVGSLSFENFLFFYSPAIFLIIHLVYVIYQKNK